MNLTFKRLSVACLALPALLGAMVTLASPASAASNTVSVTLSNTSPVLTNTYLGDSNGAGCVIQNDSHVLRYQTYQLNVTVPGIYTFTDLVDPVANTDTYIAVYPLGGFDSAHIATNCISTGDEYPAQIDLRSATSYTLVAAVYSGQANSATQNLGFDGPGEVYLGALRVAPAAIPMWVQGYVRASQSEACPDGWGASWAQWPHGGSGGWVCMRSVQARG